MAPGASGFQLPRVVLMWASLRLLTRASDKSSIIKWSNKQPPLVVNISKVNSKVLKQDESDFIVILDAGSTGTRAFAFHYHKRTLSVSKGDYVVGKPLTLPKKMFSVKRTPGISSFSEDFDGLRRYLLALSADIVELLRSKVDDIKLKEVPLYLGATAGMRDLDGSARDEVFEHIRAALRDTPFAFTIPAQARVLSGEEEACFDWLTVNHGLGRIGPKWNLTYGALDMGGESAEVVFIPPSSHIMEGLFPMHFGPFPGTVHIYTHSYMHYGAVAAFQRASTQLLSSNSLLQRDRMELQHPCLPRGLRWHVDNASFGFATSGDVPRKDGAVDMRGTGDFWQCVEISKHLFFDAPCVQAPCTFLGVYQPNMTGVNFWMTGQFTDLWRVLGLPFEDDGERIQPVLELLQDGGKQFCSLSLREQEHYLEKTAQVENSELACWLSAWSYSFLVHGLGFAPNTPALRVVKGDVDWPIGAAIYHVNFYPYKDCRRFEFDRAGPLFESWRGMSLLGLVHVLDDSDEHKAPEHEARRKPNQGSSIAEKIFTWFAGTVVGAFGMFVCPRLLTCRFKSASALEEQMLGK